MCCQRRSWYLWAAEDPQGSEHSKAAVLLPRSGPFAPYSPTEVGFSQGHRAGRAEPSPSELLECPLHISSGLQEKGRARDAADRDSDAWSQLELSFKFTTPWLKQTASANTQYIKIYYGPFSNKMNHKLLATVISWSTVLADYNYQSVQRKGITQKLFGPWPSHMAGECRPGAPGQGFQLTCILCDRLPSAMCSVNLPIALHPLTSQGPGDSQCFPQLSINHGWALLLPWEAPNASRTCEAEDDHAMAKQQMC